MRIFVTATNTDIGKTYTTLKLIDALSAEGIKVGVIKPMETGVDSAPLDGTKLLNALHKNNPSTQYLTMDDIVPIQYQLPAAPFISSNNQKLELDLILEKIKLIEKSCDIIIIEGAGGLYVPIDSDTMMIDLIEKLNIDLTLLVTHCNLGCINDTILSQKALEAKEISYETIFNCHETASFAITSLPYINKYMKKSYFLQENISSLIKKIKQTQ